MITRIRGSHGKLIEARVLCSPVHRTLANAAISLKKKKCKTNKKKKATKMPQVLIQQAASGLLSKNILRGLV